jgi:hypothetical protein
VIYVTNTRSPPLEKAGSFLQMRELQGHGRSPELHRRRLQKRRICKQHKRQEIEATAQADVKRSLKRKSSDKSISLLL